MSERDIYNQWPRDWTTHRPLHQGERGGKLENLGVDVVKKLEKKAGVMQGMERGQK